MSGSAWLYGRLRSSKPTRQRWLMTLPVTLLFIGLLVGGCQQAMDQADLAAINAVRGDNFVVFGDCRGGYSIFDDIVEIITRLEDHPEGIVMAGDLIADPGNMFQWSCFLDEIEPFRPISPSYPVVGNHDVDDYASLEVMKEVFSLPSTYYTLFTKNIFFIILDTEEPGYIGAIGPTQRAWLIEQLDHQPASAEYIMIVLHRPLFPVTAKGALWDRDYYHALFVQYGVDVVLAGHEHLYAHQIIDGIDYVTTGGAGSPLYPGFPGSFFHFVRFIRQDGYLLFQVIKSNGDLYEEFQVESQPNMFD